MDKSAGSLFAHFYIAKYQILSKTEFDIASRFVLALPGILSIIPQ